jgi:hypothetical protein
MSSLSRRRATVGAVASAAALAGLFGAAPPVRAASHSDAPLIKLDPQANITDVYTFVGMRGNTKVLNVIVQVHPFCEPGDGVMYDKFSDDALYSIHIADPNTGATLRRYDFRFSGPSAGLKNPNTVLSYGLGTAAGPITNNTDATRNYTQTYAVSRRVGNGGPAVIGSNLVTPPPNVGKNTTPNYNDPATGFAKSGATTTAGLDNYTRDAISDLNTGETVFAGSREDGFFCDIPGIFDLLDGRLLDNNGNPNDGLGQDGNGVDGFKGFNVLVYAIQIPVSQLPAVQFSPITGAFPGFSKTTTGVGVYASVSRPRITLRSTTGAPTSVGDWVQVNRMGNPFFNEGLVALKDKDNFNRDTPLSDPAKYATYAENCELAFLINFVIFKSATPDTGPLAVHGRADLKAIFIPEVLRVSTNTDPVRLAGTDGFSRLGFIGGDATTGGSTLSSGWPNGRRLGDDVADIALTAIASGPTYATVTVVGDNVASNDQVFNQVFPYAGTPHSGTMNRKDPL